MGQLTTTNNVIGNHATPDGLPTASAARPGARASTSRYRGDRIPGARGGGKQEQKEWRDEKASKKQNRYCKVYYVSIVCMYACIMYVCTYACIMYVCLYHVCMYACIMYVCMLVLCMYVCIY